MTHCRFQMFQFLDLCQTVLGYLFLLDSCWAEEWKMETRKVQLRVLMVVGSSVVETLLENGQEKPFLERVILRG